MNILVIDNRRQVQFFGARSIVADLIASAPFGAQVVVRRAPDHDLPKNFPDGIVISGSATSCLETGEAWIPEHEDYLSRAIDARVPILGICYGHQILARIIAKKTGFPYHLRKSPAPEFGWAKIHVSDSGCPILEGLSGTFYSYVAHFEEIETLPAPLINAAHSKDCAIQAFYHPDLPIFGIQFHPETKPHMGDELVSQKVTSGQTLGILNPGKGSALYHESTHQTLFGNFCRIVAQSHSP